MGGAASKRFPMIWKLIGLEDPVPEYRFARAIKRNWRFDYAWPDRMLALEVEGGTWRRGGGAHRGTGFLRDLEKYNEATILGWRVLRVTPEQFATGKALALVARLIGENADGRRNQARVSSVLQQKG